MIDVRLGEHTYAFHPYALRDACPCAECRHPVSGQRLFETAAVVPGAAVASSSQDDGGLTVLWEDGHRSRFTNEWLAAAGSGPRTRRPPVLWDATLPVPRFSLDARLGWLSAVVDYGFAVVESGGRGVDEVAETFGHVRVTNYGRTFDVRVKIDATNLADTGRELSLHTDNPYRDPVPGLQLLQCVETAAAGGETVVADGFRAVAQLDPAELLVLSTTPIRFAYEDAAARLAADVPIVELDIAGAPRALHVNNRSKGVPAGSVEEVGAWYDAYFGLLDALAAPDAQLEFLLQPGEVLVFDNLRILHGRRGFGGTGERVLRGCYADRDALLSAVALEA
jgi:gamma-butyrobetaine dioxygenase